MGGGCYFRIITLSECKHKSVPIDRDGVASVSPPISDRTAAVFATISQLHRLKSDGEGDP